MVSTPVLIPPVIRAPFALNGNSFYRRPFRGHVDFEQNHRTEKHHWMYLWAAHHLQVHRQRRKEKRYNQQVFQVASDLRWYPSGTRQHTHIQSSCQEVQIQDNLLTNFWNLRKVLSLSEPDFFHQKMCDNNSCIAWLLWSLCEIKYLRQLDSARHLEEVLW